MAPHICSTKSEILCLEKSVYSDLHCTYQLIEVDVRSLSLLSRSDMLKDAELALRMYTGQLSANYALRSS